MWYLPKRFGKTTTLLCIAIDYELVEIVQFIVENNPESVYLRGDFDETPLHLAVCNDNLKIVEILIKSNSNLNARDKFNSTPLDDAYNYYNRSIINLLNDNVNSFGDKTRFN